MPSFKTIFGGRMVGHIGISIVLQVLWEYVNAPTPPSFLKRATEAVLGKAFVSGSTASTTTPAHAWIESMLPSFLGPSVAGTPVGSVHAPWAMGFFFTVCCTHIFLFPTLPMEEEVII